MGGRILVFGKPGTVLADIHLGAWPGDGAGRRRAVIQRTLSNNRPEPELVGTSS